MAKIKEMVKKHVSIVLGYLLFPTIFNLVLMFLDCSIRQFCKEQLHELKIDKKCPK